MDSARLVQSETGQPSGAERQDRAVTPPLDTAALRAELDVLFFEDVEDAARRPAARQRAQQIYDDPRAPDVLRAQAAGVMGQAYWVEERMTDACRWFGLADQLDPDNGAYTTPLTRVCAS